MWNTNHKSFLNRTIKANIVWQIHCQHFENEDNEFVIQYWLFDVKKKYHVEKPCCLENESSSKQCIENFNEFTDNGFDVWIEWVTQKAKTMFRDKDNMLECRIGMM